MKVNPIGDKIACISILKIGCQLILLQNLQTFHTPLNVVNYDIVIYVGSNYKLKVNDHSTKYTMKVGALKHFRLILSSIEKAHIVSKIVVLFKLENGLECLRILQNDKKK